MTPPARASKPNNPPIDQPAALPGGQAGSKSSSPKTAGEVEEIMGETDGFLTSHRKPQESCTASVQVGGNSIPSGQKRQRIDDQQQSQGEERKARRDHWNEGFWKNGQWDAEVQRGSGGTRNSKI